MVPSPRAVSGDDGWTVVTLAHIAGFPVEEWFLPFITSAGVALVGMRARFGSSQSSITHRNRRGVDHLRGPGNRPSLVPKHTKEN